MRAGTPARRARHSALRRSSNPCARFPVWTGTVDVQRDALGLRVVKLVGEPRRPLGGFRRSGQPTAVAPDAREQADQAHLKLPLAHRHPLRDVPQQLLGLIEGRPWWRPSVFRELHPQPEPVDRAVIPDPPRPAEFALLCYGARTPPAKPDPSLA